MQDTAPVEGTAVEGAEPAPDAPMDSGGMAPGAMGDAPDGVIPDAGGEGSGGEFPAGDDMPFGDAADGGTPLGMEAGEPPPRTGFPSTMGRPAWTIPPTALMRRVTARTTTPCWPQ